MTISITITILLSQLLSVNILSLSQLLNNNDAHYVVWYLFTRAIIYAFMYFCARVYIYTIYTLPFLSDKKYIPPLYIICVILDFLVIQKYHSTALNPFY